MDQNINSISENEENVAFHEVLRMLDISQQTVFLDRSKKVSENEALELLSCSQEITNNFRMILS